MKDEYLNKEEKKKLMEIAKLSVTEAVTGKRQFLPNVTEERLKEKKKRGETKKNRGSSKSIFE